MRRKLLIAMASTVFGVCAAQALVLYESDFENYALGMSLKGTNGWGVINETVDQGAVVVSTNSAIGSGGQAMHFRDTDSASIGNSLIYRQVNGIVSNGVAVFTFDFMAPTAEQTPHVLLQLAGTSVVQLTLHPNSADTGPVKYHDGSGFQSLPANLSINTWYRFTLTANVDTDTFDLVVTDGTSTNLNVNGLAFRNAVDNINRIAFSSNAAAGQTGADYYFDNVTAGNDVALGPPLPAIFVGVSSESGNLIKIEISSTEPARNFLYGKTDLVTSSWEGVPHSDDGLNPFIITNLDYSSEAPNGNIVIFVNATNAASFFGTGHQE